MATPISRGWVILNSEGVLSVLRAASMESRNGFCTGSATIWLAMGQPESAPAGFPGPHFVRSPEALKNVQQFVRGYPHTRVGD